MDHRAALQKKRREREAELQTIDRQIAAYENRDRYQERVTKLNEEIERQTAQLSKKQAELAGNSTQSAASERCTNAE